MYISLCRILGTAGQPVEDIYRYSEMEDRLAMLENTLVWGHTAPTAPDTLGDLHVLLWNHFCYIQAYI